MGFEVVRKKKGGSGFAFLFSLFFMFVPSVSRNVIPYHFVVRFRTFPPGRRVRFRTFDG
jgi:hypothetical protein